ncbi:MAG: hypothetical protein ABSH06_29045 [Thermodesulfobacteriota bacterium]|jgi:hypothetical protein
MERLKKLVLALAVAIMFASIPASAQNLCPPTKALPEGVDDLRMVEGDFTFSKGIESLRWLEKDIWDVIREHKTTEELMMSTERFGIPFPKSVSTIKGVLLRQQALLERERFEIARLRLKAGSGSKADVEAAQKRFENARREFCKFLEKAKWVD